MNTNELIDYYANLLIMQYVGKPKAYATIQTITAMTVMPQVTVDLISFSAIPTSGQFSLVYPIPNAEETIGPFAFNVSAGTIQTAVRTITGLDDALVTGDFTEGFTITLVNVPRPTYLFQVTGNTLEDTNSDPVSISVVETDQTLPIAVENGFDLLGDNIAVGAQLDILGKYAGVSRTGPGFTTVITLNDADFLQLIRMAIALNTAGSSLYDIQAFLNQFFPEQIFIFDFKDMTIAYAISSEVGNLDLIQRFVAGGYLPRPMAVQIPYIIYTPSLDNAYGFRTYDYQSPYISGFNSYLDYQTDAPWISYANGIII